MNRVSIHTAGTPLNANSTLLAQRRWTPASPTRIPSTGTGSRSTALEVRRPSRSTWGRRPAYGLHLPYPLLERTEWCPGAAIGYQVTVRNNSNSGCGSSTFGFAQQIPSGWSGAVPSSLSLEAGQSATVNWSVTSPTSNVAQQSYPLAVTASD